MDEQLAKQKIDLELKVDADMPCTESLASTPECTLQLEVPDSDSEPVPPTPTDPIIRLKRPTGSYALRKWPEAILTFLMVNTYLAIMMQFSLVIAHGGIGAWWELVKFNFLELTGFILIGSSQLQPLMQPTGQLRIFFITTLIYWSLFLIYPIFILNNDGRAFGEKQSTKAKWRDVLISVVSLVLFMPMPLIAFWRYGGILRFLGFTDTSLYEQRGVELRSTVEDESASNCLPESLLTATEFAFNQSLLIYIYIFCLAGPMRISLTDFGFTFGIFVFAQLWVAVLNARKKAVFRGFGRENTDSFMVTGLTLMTIPSMFFELNRSHFQVTPAFIGLSLVFIIGAMSCAFRLKREFFDKLDVTTKESQKGP